MPIGASTVDKPLHRLGGPHLLILGMNLVPRLRQFARCLLERSFSALPAFGAHGLQLTGRRQDQEDPNGFMDGAT
jgi:hypothetical protein